MDHLTESCSKDTEGLVLSSFQVLQDSSGTHQHNNMLHPGHRLHTSYLDDSGDGDDEHHQRGSVSTTSTNSDSCSNNAHHQQHQHSCDEGEEEEDAIESGERGAHRGEEVAEGDEMFDVHPHNVEDVGRYRGDEAIDSLVQDGDDDDDDDDDDAHHNRMIGDEDDGDDEEDEDEEEDDDAEAQRSEGTLQQANILAGEDNLSPHCANPAMPDMRTQQQFVQFPHGTLLGQPEGWPNDGGLSESEGRFTGEWHLSLQHSGQGLPEGTATPALPHTLHTEDGRHCEHPQLQHQQHQQQQLWASEAPSSNVVPHQSWVEDKGEEDEDEIEELEEGEEEEEDEACPTAHELQEMHHGGVDGQVGHWVARQPHQGDLHSAWHKDMGELYTNRSTMAGNMFPGQHNQGQMAADNSFTDMVQPRQARQQQQQQTWAVGGQLPTGPPISAIPRQFKIGLASGCATVCSQQQPRQPQQSAFYCPQPSQACTVTLQGHGPWPQQQVPPPVHIQPSPSLEAEHHSKVVPGDHFHHPLSLTQPAQQGLRFKGQGRMIGDLQGGHGVRELQHGKVKTRLPKTHQNNHPYQPKEEKQMVKEVYPAMAANIHTLKASHIVSWYIDYLIHENEHLTQISRALSLPVNLFHSEDFYFMDSLKKKVHFPSLKFLSWMQQNLPSINVSAVDFHEGRASQVGQPSTTGEAGNPGTSGASSAASLAWGGQQFHSHLQQQELPSWQNKSRRDIIHDVFYYFQHQRVTCQN